MAGNLSRFTTLPNPTRLSFLVVCYARSSCLRGIRGWASFSRIPTLPRFAKAQYLGESQRGEGVCLYTCALVDDSWHGRGDA